jgi:hypothetical protein
LEQALLREAVYRASPGQIGEERSQTGVDQSWLREAARSAGASPLPRLRVTVSQQGLENKLLSDALAFLGCTVEREEIPGVPVLRMGTEGHLSARDEQSQPVGGEQLLLLTLAILMERGERRLAVPASAPASAEKLAEQFGATLYRLERDGSAARSCYAAHPALWDPLYAACLILGQMGRTGLPLFRLLASLPPCVICRTEVTLQHGRGALMQAMAEKYPEAEHMPDGLRFRVGSGSVWISPRVHEAALAIAAEAADSEVAEELCALIRQQAKELDEGAAPKPGRIAQRTGGLCPQNSEP